MEEEKEEEEKKEKVVVEIKIIKLLFLSTELFGIIIVTTVFKFYSYYTVFENLFSIGRKKLNT